MIENKVKGGRGTLVGVSWDLTGQTRTNTEITLVKSPHHSTFYTKLRFHIMSLFYILIGIIKLSSPYNTRKNDQVQCLQRLNNKWP